MPIITTAGAVPTPILTLNADLIAEATALSPGLTADLPASLIEDMSSTATGAVALQDQASVDLINSVSPLTANPFILKQLGLVYGVRPGLGANTSVLVVFTGTAGFVVNIGFIVGDGTHQYVTQEPAILSGTGTTAVSAPTFCIAIDSGSWAVPVNTVTVPQTSVPPSIILTCTNPSTGVPASDPQTNEEYQAQVIQAGQAVATGISTLVRTAIGKVSGVQARLISFRQTGGGWQVIVGGGDPYQVANAIFQSMFNIIDLEGASAGGSTQTVTIDDFPDSYTIVYVEPAQQTVEINVTWNTVANANFVSPDIVAAQVQPAIANYINSIFVGQTISLLLLQDAFIQAVQPGIPESALSQLEFLVKINGVEVDPPVGGVLISGDPESYFFAESSGIIVAKA